MREAGSIATTLCSVHTDSHLLLFEVVLRELQVHLLCQSELTVGSACSQSPQEKQPHRAFELEHFCSQWLRDRPESLTQKKTSLLHLDGPLGPYLT